MGAAAADPGKLPNGKRFKAPARAEHWDWSNLRARIEHWRNGITMAKRSSTTVPAKGSGTKKAKPPPSPDTRPTPAAAGEASSESAAVGNAATPPSTVPKSDGTSKNSKTSKTPSAGDADYRDRLAAHNIHFKKKQLPEGLLDWAMGIISRSRQSPDINDHDVKRAIKYPRLLEDDNEDEVVKHISPFVAPVIDPGNERIAHKTNRIWQNGARVPYIGNGTDPPAVPLSWPKPDIAYGFVNGVFTERQQDVIRTLKADDGQSYACPDGMLYFPFCTWEIKSPKVAIQFAQNQNANSAGIAMQCIYELLKRAESADPTNGELDFKKTAFFGVSMNHMVIMLEVSYIDLDEKKRPRFNVAQVDTWLLDKPESLRSARRAFRNINDVFSQERFQMVTDILDKLAKKSGE